MYDTMKKIEKAVDECLDNIKLDFSKCRRHNISCDKLNVGGPGVYVFYDDWQIYYVGQANNVKRRLGNEHCAAHIGGSEGVVRFLMYFIDENFFSDFFNDLSQDWPFMNAVEREEHIKERVLKPFIYTLSIYVLTCDELKNPNPKQVNPERKKLEECLRGKLKPILNPLS